MDTAPWDTSKKMKSKECLQPTSLLAEAIGRIMPIAHQIALGKNKEPTFYNVLDVIAECCDDWRLARKSIGTWVLLSTGWTFVLHADTVITDNTAMDEAVLLCLRNLSSATKSVKLVDLCDYIAVAFKFPKILSPEEVLLKVQCSTNLLRAWDRILFDNGQYRLVQGTSDSDSPKGSAAQKSHPPKCETEASTTLVSATVRTDTKCETDSAYAVSPETAQKKVPAQPEVGDKPAEPETLDKRRSKPSPETSEAKIDAVLDSDQVSIISSSDSRRQTSARKRRVERNDVARRPPRTNVLGPFLFYPNCYKLHVMFVARKDKAMHLGSGGCIRKLLNSHGLHFQAVRVSQVKTHMAFVEFEDLQDATKAIEVLHGSFYDKGAFKLRVKWASPTERDYQDARYIRAFRGRAYQMDDDNSEQQAASADSGILDRRSAITARKRQTHSPSVGHRRKRRRSRSRSGRRSRSRSRRRSRSRSGRRRSRSRSQSRSRGARQQSSSPSPIVRRSRSRSRFARDRSPRRSRSPVASRQRGLQITAFGSRMPGSPLKLQSASPVCQSPPHEQASSLPTGWGYDTWVRLNRLVEPFQSANPIPTILSTFEYDRFD